MIVEIDLVFEFEFDFRIVSTLALVLDVKINANNSRCSRSTFLLLSVGTTRMRWFTCSYGERSISISLLRRRTAFFAIVKFNNNRDVKLKLSRVGKSIQNVV